MAINPINGTSNSEALTGVNNAPGDHDDIRGFAGDDTIKALGGDDTVDGGDDDDLIFGNTGKDNLNGDHGDDTIYGGADNDRIGGGEGDDVLYGQLGDDDIFVKGNDTAYGGLGSDFIYGRDVNNVGFLLYGDNNPNSAGGGDDDIRGGKGNDTIYSGSGDDEAYGYDGKDLIYGNLGDDTLDGGDGDDTLRGGIGNDEFDGGLGRDIMYGGRDHDSDTFRIVKGESDAVNGKADVIYDWDVRDDFIDSSIKGTSTNYAEAATTAASMAKVRSLVEGDEDLIRKDHVFLYNTRTDTGYLVSDLDRNGSFETGVIIHGAGSASDLNHTDIT